MPAVNAAGLAVVPANPSLGEFVVMSPFSGPKNSPLDARSISGYGAQNVPTYVNDPTNYSTGGVNTGIGFGPEEIIGPVAPASIVERGFNDDYTPGIDSYRLAGKTAETTAILLAIGGGKNSIVDGTGPNGNGTPAGTFISAPAPYVAQPLLGFGAGGSRDAGAGPAFTGFGMKMVTAAGAVANGGVIETGFVNRSGLAMVTGQSAFGSSTTASPAVT